MGAAERMEAAEGMKATDGMETVGAVEREWEREQDFTQKKERLLALMAEYAAQDTMVAFSGGADSSLLLKLACDAAAETGKKVYGVTVQSKLHPVGEAGEARRTAQEMGAIHLILTVDELEEAGITDNPTDRCYLCKKYLFRKMLERAGELGIPVVLEGTNEDDLHVYRPGIKALKELGIVSPLAKVHMTKEEVRTPAAAYGLAAASKPAAPCLATRFPYGTPLTYGKMRRVEQGENYLKGLGLRNVRLRVHGTVARIEVDTEEFPVLMCRRAEVAAYLKGLGYGYVTLDLEGFRSGSMDDVKGDAESTNGGT